MTLQNPYGRGNSKPKFAQINMGKTGICSNYGGKPKFAQITGGEICPKPKNLDEN